MLQADRKTTVTLQPHNTLKLEADGLQQQKTTTDASPACYEQDTETTFCTGA